MSIRTILFDLDGTLLPMDQNVFLKAYLGGMAKKMANHGYVPEVLVDAIWKGTGAMVKNDGRYSNETLFWNVFSEIHGRDTRVDEPLFEEFYRQEFQNIRQVCGFDPRAAETVRELKSHGFRLALATNPLFPAIATHSRARWAGLDPKDFALITTYDNSRYCKPNPAYYRDILETLDVKPEECLMVGNDVKEDMIAKELGMQVFLLTDCIINSENRDTDPYPQGSFPELLSYIRSL